MASAIKGHIFVWGGIAAIVATANTVSLTIRVLNAMFVTNVKATIAVALIVGFMGIGITIFANQSASGEEEAKAAAVKAAELAARQAELAAALAKADDPSVKHPTGAFGESVDGLRIKLQLAASKDGGKSPSHGIVTLENVGDADLNVHLGVSLGNGRSHHPVALRLLAIDGKNVTRLAFAEPRVAGRLDPFVVPLPAGSSYSLRCSLDNFVLEKDGGRFDFTSKDYEFEVELVGQPVTETNADLRGLTLMQLWQGTIQSN